MKTSALSQRPLRLACMAGAVLVALGAATASHAAQRGRVAEAQAQYRADIEYCNSSQSGQPRALCQTEARRAYEEARAGRLETPMQQQGVAAGRSATGQGSTSGSGYGTQGGAVLPESAGSSQRGSVTGSDTRGSGGATTGSGAGMTGSGSSSSGMSSGSGSMDSGGGAMGGASSGSNGSMGSGSPSGSSGSMGGSSGSMGNDASSGSGGSMGGGGSGSGMSGSGGAGGSGGSGGSGGAGSGR